VPTASRDVAPGTPVDATGTRRRVEALVATGWSRAKLGERLGIEPTGMSELLRREQVTAGRPRAVADLTTNCGAARRRSGSGGRRSRPPGQGTTHGTTGGAARRMG
jgi:hypothetical protein